jgi:hypothetical protein
VPSLPKVDDHQCQEEAGNDYMDGDPIVDAEQKQGHQGDEETGDKREVYPPSRAGPGVAGSPVGDYLGIGRAGGGGGTRVLGHLGLPIYG